jgi:hypothetical protein
VHQDGDDVYGDREWDDLEPEELEVYLCYDAVPEDRNFDLEVERDEDESFGEQIQSRTPTILPLAAEQEIADATGVRNRNVMHSDRLRNARLRDLFHLTPIENLPGITSSGLRAHVDGDRYLGRDPKRFATLRDCVIQLPEETIPIHEFVAFSPHSSTAFIWHRTHEGAQMEFCREQPVYEDSEFPTYPTTVFQPDDWALVHVDVSGACGLAVGLTRNAISKRAKAATHPDDISRIVYSSRVSRSKSPRPPIVNAEILVRHGVDWEAVRTIRCLTRSSLDRVEAAIGGHAHQPEVVLVRKFV